MPKLATVYDDNVNIFCCDYSQSNFLNCFPELCVVYEAPFSSKGFAECYFLSSLNLCDVGTVSYVCVLSVRVCSLYTPTVVDHQDWHTQSYSNPRDN